MRQEIEPVTDDLMEHVSNRILFTAATVDRWPRRCS